MQKEKKRVSGLIFCIITGVIMVTVGLCVFFGYVRPFERFVYKRCEMLNKDFYYPDSTSVTVVYFVDDVKYEYTFDRGKQVTGVSFYYNADNPTDVMSASRETLIILLPCIAGFGILMIVIGSIQLSQWKNKRKRGDEK